MMDAGLHDRTQGRRQPVELPCSLETVGGVLHGQHQFQRPHQKGFARMMLAAGAPAQLVTVEVSPPMLGKGLPWRSVPTRRDHWTMCVHERIDVAAVYGSETRPAALGRSSGDVAACVDDVLLHGHMASSRR